MWPTPTLFAPSRLAMPTRVFQFGEGINGHPIDVLNERAERCPVSAVAAKCRGQRATTVRGVGNGSHLFIA